MSVEHMQCDMNMHGTVTVWSKGQVVIPKKIRDSYGISEWDQMMVITKPGWWIWLVKIDDMQTFLDYAQRELQKMKLMAADKDEK